MTFLHYMSNKMWGFYVLVISYNAHNFWQLVQAFFICLWNEIAHKFFIRSHINSLVARAIFFKVAFKQYKHDFLRIWAGPIYTIYISYTSIPCVDLFTLCICLFICNLQDSNWVHIWKKIFILFILRMYYFLVVSVMKNMACTKIEYESDIQQPYCMWFACKMYYLSTCQLYIFENSPTIAMRYWRDTVNNNYLLSEEMEKLISISMSSSDQNW